MLVTKPDDISWRGWRTINNAGLIDARHGEAFRLYPTSNVARDGDKNVSTEFRSALATAWDQGGWCVYFDELYHVEAHGLKNAAIQYLTQGRSKKITTVCGVQRPAWVTRFAFSEPTHVFCAKMGDDEDRKTIGARLGKSFATTIEGLKRFDFAYLNKVTGDVRVCNARNVERVFA